MADGRVEIALYRSAPHPCSYLPQQQANTLFTDPDLPMSNALYSQLIRHGYRRSGGMVYRPDCVHCQQCRSSRVDSARFSPRRRHRRSWKANRDLVQTVRPAGFREDHYLLYQRYTAARHSVGGMADASPREYMSFLRAEWSRTDFIEFRLRQELVCVAVTDRLADGLSAVYTFFEPALAARSLGVFAILSQIELARTLGLPYLYLGYWIRDSPKMRYKREFEPVQLFIGNRWQPGADLAPSTQTPG